MKDYYAILEIPRSAELSEIKKAYRRLALKYHPDRNPDPNASRLFIEVTEAYEVLRDPERKRRYDASNDQRQQPAESPISDADFEPVYREWQRRSHAKASADASIPYEAFAKRLAKELRIGVSYVPNLIAMLFTSSGAIMMLVIIPSMAEESGGGGVLVLLLIAVGLCALTVKLFGVMRSDYAEDRKRKL